MKIRSAVMVWIMLAVGGCGLSPDAHQQLEAQCRLPKWVTLPRGVHRDSVVAVLAHYSGLLGNVDEIRVNGRDGRVYSVVRARVLNEEPIQFGPPTAAGVAPMYEVVQGLGVTDVIEYSGRPGRFCMAQDPRVIESLVPHPH